MKPTISTPIVPGDRNYKKVLEYLRTDGRLGVSVKNLRIYVIMIAIYHVMVSHLLMFLVILALFHAEEMISILIVDIADQKEREEYYELPIHTNGETMNQVRFKAASQLATATLSALYSCAFAIGLYLMCCMFMLAGAIRYRYQLIVPWLLLHALGASTGFWMCIYYRGWMVTNILNGSHMFFWILLTVGSILDLIFFIMSYQLCVTLQSMQKMTVSATIAIPYPKNRTIPTYIRQEDMYIGDGGHKHRVFTDNCNPNYVV